MGPILDIKYSSSSGTRFIHNPAYPAYPPIYPNVFNFNKINAWRDQFDKVIQTLCFKCRQCTSWTFERSSWGRLRLVWWTIGRQKLGREWGRRSITWRAATCTSGQNLTSWLLMTCRWHFSYISWQLWLLSLLPLLSISTSSDISPKINLKWWVPSGPSLCGSYRFCIPYYFCKRPGSSTVFLWFYCIHCPFELTLCRSWIITHKFWTASLKRES